MNGIPNCSMLTKWVILTGKLSFREDEEPKLLVDTVQPLTKEAADQIKLSRSIAFAQKSIGATPPKPRSVPKTFARLSDENIQTILAYPDAAAEVEVNTALLLSEPRSL